MQQQPTSPSASLKTNASSSTLQTEAAAPSYQQFPAQMARVPTSHSQVQLESHQVMNTSPSQPSTSQISQSISSAQATGLARETSWPVEGFSDLHLSGSELRIFPGIVSRSQRKNSLIKKNSMSETDEQPRISRKGASSLSNRGSVDDQELSDDEMEEAGGRDG